jgi:ubiquinone biosynthesis accessory factor UbiK
MHYFSARTRLNRALDRCTRHEPGPGSRYNGVAISPFEDSLMLDPKQLDDLAQRLAGSLPQTFLAFQEDIGRGLRAALEAGLGRLDLVTREQFDVQSAVLLRTRQRLEALETRLGEIETRLGVSGKQEP